MLVRCNKADDPRCPWPAQCERGRPHSESSACPIEVVCPRNLLLRVRCVKVKEAKET